MSEAAVAYVGMGANLPCCAGTPRQTLDAALDALGALPGARLEAASSVYTSDPVDADGPSYFNQVARLSTALSASALLDELQAIEDRFGRERPRRNAPRTLDLDLLMLGDQRLETPRLTLPHPRMHQRLFVLMPLAELDPGLVIPGHGKVAACLAAVRATQAQRCAPAS